MKTKVIILLVLVAVGIGVIVALISTFQPSYSANGLEFAMSLNSSELKWGNNLTVSLNLYNTLQKVNNVSFVEAWRLTDQSECGEQCGTVGEFNCAQNDVFRIEVVSGYYNLNNFTKGTPLDVFPFQPPLGQNQCGSYVRAADGNAPPLFVPYSKNYYIFSPKSNEAEWVASGLDNVNQKAVMSETMVLEPVLFTNSTGVFTVVGGDGWGDLQIAHFYIGTSPNG